MKRIITLGGMPGSGKSSAAKILAERLRFRHFSSGDFLREVATSHGWTIDEFNKAAETDPRFDREVDDLIRKTGLSTDVVIDSRLAFHWIPDSFKVFLTIDPHTAAERTFAQLHSEGRVGQAAADLSDIYQKMLARIESEKKRYAALYGIDYLDESQYDLVVDTAHCPLQEVVDAILRAFEKRG